VTICTTLSGIASRRERQPPTHLASLSDEAHARTYVVEVGSCCRLWLLLAQLDALERQQQRILHRTKVIDYVLAAERRNGATLTLGCAR